MNNSEEIERLKNRHVAKLLTRIEERYAIEEDIKQSIKAQFRLYAEDVKSMIKVSENDNGNYK